MKIAIWTDHRSMSWGGSEVLWIETAKCLAKQGHEVSAVFGKSPVRPQSIEALVNAGVDILEVPPPRPGILSRCMTLALRKICKVNPEKKFYDKVLRLQPDLVFVSLSYIPILSIPLLSFLRDSKIPFATLMHGVNPLWRVDSATAPRMRSLASSAVANFFVSEDNTIHWGKYVGAAIPNASVIRNPFKVSREVRLPWPDSAQGLKLACVARLDMAVKGQDFIIELLAQDKWKERKVTVDFYGDGPSRDMLENLAKDWGCDHKIAFKGHVENIEEIWKDHHALILLSRYEGLPLAVVEAMHCGRICLVTDVAGNREVVDHGRTGFVAKGSNIRSIEEAMEEAWSRREEWAAMGNAAWESIREIIPADPAEVFAKQLAKCISR